MNPELADADLSLSHLDVGKASVPEVHRIRGVLADCERIERHGLRKLMLCHMQTTRTSGGSAAGMNKRLQRAVPARKAQAPVTVHIHSHRLDSDMNVTCL